MSLSNNQFTYTPPNSFEGNDSFQYTICTSGGEDVDCDTATVNIEVLAASDPNDSNVDQGNAGSQDNQSSEDEGVGPTLIRTGAASHGIILLSTLTIITTSLFLSIYLVNIQK